jgi:hypothetical protein
MILHYSIEKGAPQIMRCPHCKKTLTHIEGTRISAKLDEQNWAHKMAYICPNVDCAAVLAVSNF